MFSLALHQHLVVCEGVYTPRFRELTRNYVRSYRYRITCSANTGSILAYRFPFLT